MERRAQVSLPEKKEKRTISIDPKAPECSQTERVFRYFDMDGDGKISPAELQSCVRMLGGELSEEEAATLVSSGDGFLGFDEFAKLMEADGEEEKEEDLREAFSMYEEKAGCGTITPKSLKKMLSRLHESRTIEECKAMISTFDQNGDGVLSFEEFRAMMMMHFPETYIYINPSQPSLQHNLKPERDLNLQISLLSLLIQLPFSFSSPLVLVLSLSLSFSSNSNPISQNFKLIEMMTKVEKRSLSFNPDCNHLERLFRYFDEDGDGKISATELQSCVRTVGGELSTEEAEAVVGSSDSDGDGLLGMDDFARLMEGDGEDGDLREAFGMYAMDGCDFITAKTLKRMLRRLGESRTIRECKGMISVYDLNGDGVLSFEEFRAMMR
ncbi:uncharacterized protein LOC122072992 [Macadamia integrifolia]|uniref:uncharacterized protein LOC122072992 n=1 Tax=Macadamia integrifolia TaxID=60698 RepID=UPI001C4EEC03|nr:uncharacterized protein LOC122072992 [Macadamia integrifolia]